MTSQSNHKRSLLTSITSSECRKCSWLSCWYTKFPMTYTTKNFPITQNFISFQKWLNIQWVFDLAWKDHMHVIQEKSIFYHYDATNDVTASRTFSILYSFLNDIGTFFTITLKRYAIRSLNSTSRCTMSVCPCLQKMMRKNIINNVIISTNMSKFWTTETSLTFKQGHRSNAPNIGIVPGYLTELLDFGLDYDEKVCQDPKVLCVLKNYEIFYTALIWYQVWNDHIQIIHEKYISSWRHN